MMETIDVMTGDLITGRGYTFTELIIHGMGWNSTVVIVFNDGEIRVQTALPGILPKYDRENIIRCGNGR